VIVRIKNCGLKTLESIDCSVSSGAGFVGFVHHETSPRHVSISDMRRFISYACGRSKTVAVLVNPSDALLDAAVSANPDYIQLHGVESPLRIQAIRIATGKPIITAIAVGAQADLTSALSLEEISEYLLFDAAHAGSGKAFDWALLNNIPLKKRWFLAGGLTSENVGEAICITGASMVDVSSGIEDSPGNKSLIKIAAFNAAVLDAGHG
jgi:phosphoribosylanthranilate isomerase